MAFLDDNGLLYLWSKIKNLVSTAVSSISTAWTDITDKPLWIGDTKPDYTADEVGAISVSAVGAASGVASLDSSGKVPTSQLPSYVDDVIEGYLSDGVFYSDSSHTTAMTGETGKIYIDLSTEKCYRFGGSAYVEISQGENISAITNSEIDTICTA